MDAICARCHIEGWAHNWVEKEHGPIHKHLMVFWDTQYKNNMETIAEKFIPGLYHWMFNSKAPCISWRAMGTLIDIAHWFPQEGVIIQVFRMLQAPHALPRFVPDKVLLQEVCYQMTMGFTMVLTKGKKKPWPSLPLTIGAYTVKDFRAVEAEAEQIKVYHLTPMSRRTYDPNGVIPEHCKRAKFKWMYNHTPCAHEDDFRNWYNRNRKDAPEEGTNDQTQEAA